MHDQIFSLSYSSTNCFRILGDFEKDQCPSIRDKQAIAIAKSGGVIGINVCEEFVGETVEEQTLEKLIDHMDYFKQLIGVDDICCGFDF